MTTPQNTASAKKIGFASIILILGLVALLGGEVYFGLRLHALSNQQEQLKEDYSTVNNITFGVFSIDQWRDKISAVVNGHVQDFSLTAAQKRAMQRQVEQELNGLVNKVIAGIDKPQKGLGAKLKKMAFHALVKPEEIHAQVPSFAKTIVDKVTSPESEHRLKSIATGKLTQLEKQTYDNTFEVSSVVDKKLFNKYHVTNADAYNKEIDRQLVAIRTVTYNYAYAMTGCIVLALALWWLMRRFVNIDGVLFALSLLFAFVLLIVGVTVSIIEVDARVQSFNFMLMGQQVSFNNQVLFFQSKSIIGIIQTLVAQNKPDAVVIGVLIFIFVIVLPIVRMVAKGIHILSPKKVAENGVVKYLAFDSNKWDMADVMVVGILMTYIGLNGILKSQLANMNIHNAVLNTATVNNSALQPGYFIFVVYVVYAFILSRILTRITPYQIVPRRTRQTRYKRHLNESQKAA